MVLCPIEKVISSHTDCEFVYLFSLKIYLFISSYYAIACVLFMSSHCLMKILCASFVTLVSSFECHRFAIAFVSIVVKIEILTS